MDRPEVSTLSGKELQDYIRWLEGEFERQAKVITNHDEFGCPACRAEIERLTKLCERHVGDCDMTQIRCDAEKARAETAESETERLRQANIKLLDVQNEEIVAREERAFEAGRLDCHGMEVGHFIGMKYHTFANYLDATRKGSWVTKSSDELAKELGVEKRATYKSMRGDE